MDAVIERFNHANHANHTNHTSSLIPSLAIEVGTIHNVKK